MSQIVYLNGYLIPRSQALISALDYGFLFGLGLFETMRAYKGRVFHLERHLDRLASSAKVLGLSLEAPELKGAVMDTIKANKLGDARIRITISSGEGTMTPDPSTCHRPTVLILAEDYQPYPETIYQKGFRAVVSSIRRHSQSPLSWLKSTSYLESMLSREEARAAGADEALLLNDRGLLAEASMSNIFVVRGGRLKTPRKDSGILPGITRETALELASKLGIDALECDIRLDELLKAEEAFLTNSLIEVMPLTEVNSRPIGAGRPGAVTQELMAAYRDLTLADTPT